MNDENRQSIYDLIYKELKGASSPAMTTFLTNIYDKVDGVNDDINDLITELEKISPISSELVIEKLREINLKLY